MDIAEVGASARDRLNSEVRKIVLAKEMEKVLHANGIEPDGSTPEQLAAYIRKDFEQWRKVIGVAGIKVE